MNVRIELTISQFILYFAHMDQKFGENISLRRDSFDNFNWKIQPLIKFEKKHIVIFIYFS
jgi:hypothetical protein